MVACPALTDPMLSLLLSFIIYFNKVFVACVATVLQMLLLFCYFSCCCFVVFAYTVFVSTADVVAVFVSVAVVVFVVTGAVVVYVFALCLDLAPVF